jgi:RHS repeat-associated protein
MRHHPRNCILAHRMHFCVKRHTTTIAFYDANVQSASDYYAFGQLLPGRNTGENYRYGFQGQEEEDEVKGAGNSVNYKYRMHDPRLGRFFAVDPLAKEYPHNSPYAFSENVVINAVELEGLEKMYTYVFNSNTREFDYTWTKTNKDLKENVNRYIYFDVHGEVSKTVIHSMDGDRSKTFQGKESNDVMRLSFRSTKDDEMTNHSAFESSFRKKDDPSSQWEGNNEPANNPDPRTGDALIEIGKRTAEFLIEKSFPFELPLIIPELIPNSNPYKQNDKIMTSKLMETKETESKSDGIKK